MMQTYFHFRVPSVFLALIIFSRSSDNEEPDVPAPGAVDVRNSKRQRPPRFPPEARQTDSSSDAVAAHIIFHSPNDACSSNTRSTKFKLSIHQFFCSIAGGIPPPKNAR